MSIKNSNDQVDAVIQQFQVEGELVNIKKIESGNVNRTYCLTYQKPDNTTIKYTLQRINTFVFKNPKQVMANILAVTEHLKMKFVKKYGSWERKSLSIVKTIDEELYLDSEELGFWRCFVYVDGAVAYDKVEKPEHFLMAGSAFGEFQMELSDFDATELYETIKDFHNTKKRFENFVNVVKADPEGRAESVKEEIDFILKREKECSLIVDMLDNGTIPIRVTHNDTKLNNVLIDENTGEAICVIDLDTVMPGTSLYDFGDAIRFGANTGDEDDENLDNVTLDLNLYEYFTKGFVGKVTGFLTEAEIDYLPLGAYIITLELAIRFLTDYLQGDLYFTMKKPNHNLYRTRAQLKLVREIEEKYEQMKEIVEKYR